ncbi:hypothetical protein [Nocardia sp. NPDC051981]|uniref:hypothetical protein n=1 Tax=Nocardia sp. NPDC051981 TaxID=3155417 RepID=UPI00341CCBA9
MKLIDIKTQRKRLEAGLTNTSEELTIGAGLLRHALDLVADPYVLYRDASTDVRRLLNETFYQRFYIDDHQDTIEPTISDEKTDLFAALHQAGRACTSPPPRRKQKGAYSNQRADAGWNKPLMVDLAGRYSKRADLHKLETTRAKIDTGPSSPLPRRHKKPLADRPREPRRIEQRLGPATVEELLHAYRDGTSTTQLAARYGISKTAVLNLLTNRNVSRRFQSMTTNDVDHVERLYLAGHSLASCSRLTGFPASTIRDALRERGTPMRAPGGRHRAPR